MADLPRRTVLLAAGLLLAGCSYSNSSGTQSAPPLKRIETEPAGARLFLVERNQVFTTPCDLPYEVDEDEELVISRDGYATWRGTLEELPRTAHSTWKLNLQRVR